MVRIPVPGGGDRGDDGDDGSSSDTQDAAGRGAYGIVEDS